MWSLTCFRGTLIFHATLLIGWWATYIVTNLNQYHHLQEQEEHQTVLWNGSQIGTRTTIPVPNFLSDWAIQLTMMIVATIMTGFWWGYYWKSTRNYLFSGLRELAFMGSILLGFLGLQLIFLWLIREKQEAHLMEPWKPAESPYQGLEVSCQPNQLVVARWIPGEHEAPDCVSAWYSHSDQTLQLCCADLDPQMVSPSGKEGTRQLWGWTMGLFYLGNLLMMALVYGIRRHLDLNRGNPSQPFRSWDFPAEL